MPDNIDNKELKPFALAVQSERVEGTHQAFVNAAWAAGFNIYEIREVEHLAGLYVSLVDRAKRRHECNIEDTRAGAR